MTVDINTSAAVSLNFDKVQGLRDLKDTALSLSAYCKAGSEIIEALQEIAGAGFQGAWSLKPFDTRLRGHDENLSVLTKRAGNSIELVTLVILPDEEAEECRKSRLTSVHVDSTTL